MIKLVPKQTNQAQRAHARGEAEYLKFLRSDMQLSREDREFIARVHQYLFWRAFESKRKAPGATPPAYRSPGRKADPRLEAVLDICAVAGWPDKAFTPTARRQLLSKLMDLEWRVLRHRIDRLDDSRRAFVKRSLELQGQSKPRR